MPPTHSLETATLEYRSFSDESRFSLQCYDGRVRVYRRRNERYADICVLERDRFGAGCSVMVWAAISNGYRSPLVVIDGNLNAQRYRDIHLFHNNANISIFQHDNATSHTARDTVNFLRTITLISLMTGPLTVLFSTPSSMSGIVWTDDRGVVPTHPLTSTKFVKRSFRNGTIFHRQKSPL